MIKKITHLLIVSVVALTTTYSFANTATTRLNDRQFVIGNDTNSTLPYLLKPASKDFPANGIPSTVGKAPIIVTLDKGMDKDLMKVGDSKGSCTVLFNQHSYSTFNCVGNLHADGSILINFSRH